MDSLAEDIAAAEAALHHAPADHEARAAWLYRCWFHAAPTAQEAPAPATWPTRAEYRAAALPAVALESGWQVAGAGSDGRMRIVHADERETETALIDVVLDNPVAVPVPGARLLRRRWIERDVGGFWHLWSEPWAQTPPTRLLRIYLPLEPSAMLTAAAQLVAALPPDALWAMKLLSGLHLPGRRDAGLIYLERDGLNEAFLAPVMTALHPLLSGPRPRLTRGWRGGWVANGPGDGRSFGEAVSHALADVTPGPNFAERAHAALLPLLGHLSS